MTSNHEDEKVEVIYQPQYKEVKIQKLQPDRSIRKNDTYFLYFSVFIANLLYISGAADYVWTSPVIPKLLSNDTNVNPLGMPATTYDISLIAGLPKLSTLIGTIALGKLPDLIGRRKTLVCMALGMIISNLFVAFGKHIYTYYVFRSLFSIFFGGVAVALPVYLSEISEDHNRVKIGSFMNVCFPIGNVVSYIFGPLLSVRLFTLICILPLFPAILFFSLTVPESPVYLASISNKKRTIEALTKLRSNKSSEEIEMDYSILRKIEEARKHELKPDAISIWPFRTRALKKAFLIAFIVNMAQHSTGAAVIMSFLGPLFSEAGTQLTGNSIAIIVGIVKLFALFTTSMVVEKLGRRPLLLASSVSTGVPLFILGLYFHWKNHDVQFIESIKWLPIVVVLVYIICYSAGLGSIPMAVTSELFPSDVKSIAVSYLMTFVGILLFILISAYPIVVEILGAQYCIWFFSMNCVLGFIAIYFMLPETKGKSFQEIQMLLSK